MAFPQAGILEIGIKIPLTNIKGSLTRFESIITLEGLSVGGAESKLPKVEKQKADKKMPIAKVYGLVMLVPKMSVPISSGTAEITIPKVNPAKISPRRIDGIEIGADTNRSSVFILVSQGAMIGPTEDAVKKSVIPTKPGTREEGSTFLPMEKAKKRKSGKSTPKMRTGALK